MRFVHLSALTATLMLAATATRAQDAPASIEELWIIIQQQQAEIDALREEVRAARQDVETTAVMVAETDAKVEATGEFVEALAIVDAAPRQTTIGGYGELHYNNVDADSGDSNQIDFHRFVLYFGHEFTDRIHFFSELELEHSLAGDGAPGEIELEQAYVDFALTDSLTARTGLFLLPLGIINETHEPNTFYGVERNDVESVIVPTTWWEAGAALNGRFDNGLSWDVAMHSGLAIPTTGGNAFRVRSGRQKVAEADASDLAYTARLRYTGIAGLELAASYQYQSDASQVAGDGLDSGQLFTAHAAYVRDGFGLRALYGVWNFDGFAVEAAGADKQEGWYVEPSYRLTENWGFYARYEDVDGARAVDQFTQNEFGVNFWPVGGVVLKFDYRQRDFTGLLDGTGFDAFDLGFGYSF
ncbi:MAG: porin [Woeseiaceae bacterium]